eukprot:2500691-Pyramimonas_sp.AAC.3
MKLKVVEQMFKEKFGHGRDIVDELGTDLEQSIAAELARRRELANKKVEEEVTQKMILKRKKEVRRDSSLTPSRICRTEMMQKMILER